MDITKYFNDKDFDRFTNLTCKMIEDGLKSESDMLVSIFKKATIEEFEALVILVKIADKRKREIFNLTPDNLKMPSNTDAAMKAFRKLLEALKNKGYFDDYRFSSGVKVVDKIVIDATVYNAISHYNEEFENGNTNK